MDMGQTPLTRRKQVFGKCRMPVRVLARAVGLSYGQVSDLLNGKRGKRPAPETLRAMHHIASLCGVSFNTMWGKGSLAQVGGGAND